MFILNNHDGDQACICLSGKTYQSCCQPFHLNKSYPDTAEKLMRSRFVAFEMHLKNYVMESWCSDTRPVEFEFTQGLKWTNLVINKSKKGRKKDKEGWVTFTAYYQLNGQLSSLYEKSHFTRNQQGHWQYVDGLVKETE